MPCETAVEVPPFPLRRRQKTKATDTATPGQCRIKGNIHREGERIFHVPGGEWYDRTRIDPAKGEPWFCTEEEARAVGWRPAQAVIGDLICTSLATPIAKGRRP